MSQENKSLKSKNIALQKCLSKRKSKINKLKSNPIPKRDKAQIVRDVLSPFFSNAMISCFLRGKWQRVKNWEKDDINLALTLRLLSKKTYKLLRKRRLLPLPGLSTLNKYFKDFQIPPGYLDSVGELLKIKAKTMSARERVVCLNFDEVHTLSDLAYNQQADQVVGPHKAANVMIMRGLFKSFKMPVWYMFDTQLTPDELRKIIQCVEDAGFHVVSVTSDMGSSNQGLARDLGITVNNTCFPNPARPDNVIYWFFDIVHLVKLIRNHLLSKGFRLPSGTLINKHQLKKVIDQVYGDVTITPKLKYSLLDVREQDKQKVLPAVQLLSSSMHSGLE